MDDFDFDLDEARDAVRSEARELAESMLNEHETCSCANGCMRCLDLNERDFM